MIDELARAERDKYRRMWARPEYRRWSPGEAAARHAHEALGMKPGETLLDLGCGTGRASAGFAALGLVVLGVDHVPEALEAPIPFIEACLWDLPAHVPASDWIFCADVLEHIPEERLDRVLAGMAARMRKGGYLQIHCGPDGCGSLIGETLHVTIHPPGWWLRQIERHALVTWRHAEILALECTISPREAP